MTVNTANTVNWAVRSESRPAVVMPCPHCGAEARQGKVTDSRLLSCGGGTWRRRSCPSCGERFTTEERVITPAQAESGMRP